MAQDSFPSIHHSQNLKMETACPFHCVPDRAASLRRKPTSNQISRYSCHDQTRNKRDVLYKTADRCISHINSYRTPWQATV